MGWNHEMGTYRCWLALGYHLGVRLAPLRAGGHLIFWVDSVDGQGIVFQNFLTGTFSTS